jgi:hypothetical protein
MFAREDFSWIYYLSIGVQASIIGYMVSSFFGAVAYQWYVYYRSLLRFAAAPYQTGQAERGIPLAKKNGSTDYSHLQTALKMTLTALAQFVFWSSAGVIFYVYIGYPLLVFAVSRLFPNRLLRAVFEPPVSIIITAYNENATFARNSKTRF